MKRPDLPYLRRVVARGKEYWYFDRANSRVKLPHPDDPDFLSAYDAARRGPKPVESRKSWRNLVASYRASPAWQGLAPRTRKDYERVLQWILDTMPDHDPTKMKQPHVIAARDANLHRRRFGNYIVQVLKILFARANEIGWMVHNPARGVKPLPKPRGEADLHRPWPHEAQEAYRAAALFGTPERTAMELSVGVSQRIGDTLALRWDQIGPGGFEIVQSKTQTALLIPPTSALTDYLSLIERRGETIVTADDGGPLGYSGFAKRFRAARSVAAEQLRKDGRDTAADLMEQLTVHGWRYTAAAEMAAAGASDEEIAAVTGHKTTAMLRKYAGAERQKAHARAGQSKRGGLKSAAEQVVTEAGNTKTDLKTPRGAK